MRKAALIAAGALALPLALSLPAAAAGLIEQAQQEGFRQAQEASKQKLSPDQIKKRSTRRASGWDAQTGSWAPAPGRP